jgi:hypothetical protein
LDRVDHDQRRGRQLPPARVAERERAWRQLVTDRYPSQTRGDQVFDRTGAPCLLWISFAWSSVLILLPLYFEQIRHATPALAGLLLAPQGAGTAISTLASGAVKDSHRGARIAAVGVVAVAGTTTPAASSGHSLS